MPPLRRRHEAASRVASTTRCGSLPHFDPDLEAPAGRRASASGRACERAEAVLFAVPEYAFGIPGRSRTRSTGRSAAAPSTASRSLCSASRRRDAAHTSAERSSSSSRHSTATSPGTTCRSTRSLLDDGEIRDERVVARARSGGRSAGRAPAPRLAQTALSRRSARDGIPTAINPNDRGVQQWRRRQPVLDGTYELDRTHSTVQFAVRHVGVSTFRASFGDIDARLVIDNGSTELEAGAAVESISIGEPLEFREHVVRGSDFFAADEHPLISFRSTQIELGDDGTATVSGELEIRGISQPVTRHRDVHPADRGPVRRHQGRPRARATSTAELGDGLADAAPRRRRRPRLGRRDHRSARADEEAVMRLLAISGSLRRGSYNSALARRGRRRVRAPTIDFVFWNGLDVDPRVQRGLRRSSRTAVALLKDEILQADAVLFATPEYNGSVPGALKNALDWVSRPFDGEPASRQTRSQSSAPAKGAFGAVWAQAELRKILRTIGAPVEEARTRRRAGSARLRRGRTPPRSASIGRR